VSDDGFEALADGALLIVVLLIGSALVLTFATPTGGGSRMEGTAYAEDTRLALFRTTLDGTSYAFGGESVPIPNRTTIETILRLEAHLLARDASAYDFAAANARVIGVAERLVRPGWQWALSGGPSSEPGLFQLPSDRIIPNSHFASTWTYPALDGGSSNVRLTFVLWLSPPR
jgi:hypothetical protein